MRKLAKRVLHIIEKLRRRRSFHNGLGLGNRLSSIKCSWSSAWLFCQNDRPQWVFGSRFLRILTLWVFPASSVQRNNDSSGLEIGSTICSRSCMTVAESNPRNSSRASSRRWAEDGAGKLTVELWGPASWRLRWHRSGGPCCGSGCGGRPNEFRELSWMKGFEVCYSDRSDLPRRSGGPGQHSLASAGTHRYRFVYCKNVQRATERHKVTKRDRQTDRQGHL